MPTSFVERERKFEVGTRFEIPDLHDVVPPGSTVEESVQQLRTEYFDTSDQSLRRAGMTLRRRTGTDDTGWHLKVPHGEFREELRFPLSDDVPADMTRLLHGITRGAGVHVVAVLETTREVHRVVDAAGDAVADLDLDHVRATTDRDGVEVRSSWTELEIELASPSVSDEQLSVLARRVRDAGARPARSTSKLARALGEAPPAADSKKSSKKSSKKRKQRSGPVLRAYLEQQHRMILLGDLALRRGDLTAVHRTRVATRRFRSALRTFAAFFDAQRGRWLEGELQWYAELLGAIRDSQVLEQRLHAALEETPPELVLGPVQQRIDAHLHALERADRDRLHGELEGARYLELLTELVAWTEETPFTPRAKRPARAVVRAARSADRAVTERLAAGNSTGDVDLLHRARKAAKRARYAAEAASPIAGEGRTDAADRYRELQDLLGDHQDSVVAARLLRELGAVAGVTPGENGFTFGLLYEREQHHAETVRRKAVRIARRYR